MEELGECCFCVGRQRSVAERGGRSDQIRSDLIDTVSQFGIDIVVFVAV